MTFRIKEPNHWPTIAKCWLSGAILLAAVAAACAQEGEWRLCEVTAYAGNCPLCETTGVTANGTATSDRPYGVAASPDVRLGSHIYIPTGVGYLDVLSAHSRVFIADDRGGALRSEWRRSGTTRLDLRMRSHASAKKFGRKFLMVYISEAGK